MRVGFSLSLPWPCARSRPLWGSSPSRRSCGAAASGAVLVLLALALLCRHTHGGETLGHSCSATAACALGAMRRGQRRALSARSCLHRRFLNGIGHGRRAALAAPLPAAPHSRSLRRRRRAAALTAAWRSATAPRQRLSPLARCDVIGRARALRVAVGAVASSLGATAVARFSRRRCLRRRARDPHPGVVAHRNDGGVSLGRCRYAEAALALGVVCRSLALSGAT